jgi:hypothetical protein
VTSTQTPDTQQQDAPAAEGETRSDEPRLSTADISGAQRPPGQVEPKTDHAAKPEAEPTKAPNANIKGAAPLFADAASTELRDRWTDVQTGFVDEPRAAVEQADALVAEVMKRLADSFATERQALEQQWSRGDDVSTEELRLALRRYRSFFDRLLSV